MTPSTLDHLTQHFNLPAVLEFCSENTVEIFPLPYGKYGCYLNHRKGNGPHAVAGDPLSAILAAMQRR